MNRILIYNFSERAWLLLLVAAVFILTCLLTTGNLHSVDEAAVFVAAHNTLNTGVPHTNQMGYSLWAIRAGEEVTTLTPTGDVYTKKSPLVIALLLPLIRLGQWLPGLSTVQAALLLGPLLTAATTALLYSFARRLGYGRRAATLAGLLFVGCTMALPYAQTIFGETVSSFGLLLATFFVGLDAWPEAGSNAPSPRRPIRLLLGGLGAALAMGSNIVYGLWVPIFALALLYHKQSAASWPNRLRPVFWFALPPGLMLFGLLAYNDMRFGAWLETGYHFAPGQEGFTTPLWWGIPGLVMSPARGFLWYNPPAWLALLSWRRFHAAHRPLSRLLLAVIGAHLVIFGAWWEWWGGYAWGPRFLLPVVPLILLITLPWLQTAVAGDKWRRAGVVIVALLGIVVQIAGVAIDFNPYEERLDQQFPAPVDRPLRYHHDPALVYQVAPSPIVEHWRQLSAGANPLRRPFGDGQPAQLATIPAMIRQQQRPQDALIFLVPELLNELLDEPDLPPAYGLPYLVAPDDSRAQALFARALRDANRAWLITWYSPGDGRNWYEAHLRQEWASVSETWADDLRLILLARPPQPASWRTHTATFGPIRLTGYNLQTQGDTLFVQVTWQAAAAIDQDYVSFVHLLDDAGNVIAQQDRPPLAGYAPTTTWSLDQVVVDRFAFPLNTPPAQIQIGWYAWPSLERLPILDNGEPAPGDALSLRADN